MVLNSKSDRNQFQEKSWSKALLSYAQPKMLAMLALGFGSGLPFMMLYSKLSRWLTDVGVDKATIGAFIFITLAYSFKFIWAPVVDRARIPVLTNWLGQRRSWMMLAVLGTIIGMIVIAGSDPKPSHLLPLVVKEPKKAIRPLPKSFVESIQLNVVEPFIDIFKRLGRWMIPVFALIILYRLSDFTMGVMTQPFYAELGYTKTQVGLVQGTFGPWPMIIGSFIGGLIVVRYGMMQALLYGALFMIATNAAFAWLALQEGAVTWKLLVTIFADNISLGIVGTGFIAYMSSIASREYAATQYALMSSVWSLFNKTAAGFSGYLYEAVGAFQFFLITALFGIPAILLLLYIWRYGSALAKGVDAPKENEALSPT